LRKTLFPEIENNESVTAGIVVDLIRAVDGGVVKRKAPPANVAVGIVSPDVNVSTMASFVRVMDPTSGLVAGSENTGNIFVFLSGK